jgi:hypothetical protein
MRPLTEIDGDSDTQPRWRPPLFGQTLAMLAMAGARPTAHRTMIVSSYLVGGGYGQHMDGNFFVNVRMRIGRRRRRYGANVSAPSQAEVASRLLLDAIEEIFRRSPGLCGPSANLSLHIAHDINHSSVAEVPRHRNAFLHYFPPQPKDANNLRFEHYAALLSRHEWDCAYAVDLTDVHVLNPPPCGALPLVLVAGVDVFGTNWLLERAHATRFNETLPRKFGTFLKKPKGEPPLSCCVLGGRRDVFMPLLLAVNELIRRQDRYRQTEYANRPDVLSADGSDMVAWNHIARERGPVLTGYPWGPVTWPYLGALNRHACDNATALPTVHSYTQCKHWWLNETRGTCARRKDSTRSGMAPCANNSGL